MQSTGPIINMSANLNYDPRRGLQNNSVLISLFRGRVCREQNHYVNTTNVNA